MATRMAKLEITEFDVASHKESDGRSGKSFSKTTLADSK